MAPPLSLRRNRPTGRTASIARICGCGRAQSGLRPLTHSGSEENPRWSPDGKWIAFLSDRALPGEAANDDGEPETDSAKASRLWLIPVNGGEALPLFTEKLDVHSFAWSTDGSAIYFSVTEPLTHEQKDAQKEEWQDVIRWREQNRGDLLLKLAVAPAMARALAVALPDKSAAAKIAKGKAEDIDAASVASWRRNHREEPPRHRRNRPVARRQVPRIRYRAGTPSHRKSR